jgi:hypothetical protein
MQGMLKKTLHFGTLDYLFESVIYYIAHYLGDALIISGINKEQHFVKAFSVYPAYVITDYGKAKHGVICLV